MHTMSRMTTPLKISRAVEVNHLALYSVAETNLHLFSRSKML